MTPPSSLLDALERAPDLFESALRAFPAERLAFRPASWGGSPGERFAAVEHACHVRDIETDGYHVRFRRLLSEEKPSLVSLDGYRLAAERRYVEDDLSKALAAFRVARRATVEMLRALSADEWSRSGVFAEYGPVTAHSLAHYLRSHDQQHLACLAWLAGKLASPEPDAAVPDDRAAILQAIEAFANAYAAGDVDVLETYYADDLVKLRQGAPPESRAQVAARIRDAFARARGRVEVDNQELEVEGDMAYTRGTFTVTLTPLDGTSQAQQFTRRYLEIWRRRDGRWQVCRAIDNGAGGP
jgi:ketosteroid isomerase-like protein